MFYTKYLPMVEVGGDFFYITEMNQRVTRVFLADATGHGVQSALITMLIKSEYENLADQIPNPSDLLFSLNNIFVNKYHNLTTFFSSFIPFHCFGVHILKFSVLGNTRERRK